MLQILILCVLFVASAERITDSRRISEGYSNGYLAECPGAHNPAVITEKNMKHIKLVVQGEGNPVKARRTKYSYYSMKKLAEDPEMNPKRRTALYIGGFLDSPGFPFAWVIGSHYKDLGYNVIHTDSNYFTTVHYPIAVRLMRPYAKHVAEMLGNLTHEGVINPKKLELIGLSLGSQIMSYIAKEYRSLTGMNISSLIGLDPAGPCYRTVPDEDRLNPSDGDFVTVVHTNIDGFGIATPSGHVDFYVNGGENQPGDILWTPCEVFCSHIRSYLLWLSALKHPSQFIGIQCDSVQQARDRNCYDRKPLVTNILGHNIDKTKQGIFYLSTDNNFPYFLGKKGLSKQFDYFTSILDSNPESVLYY